LFPPSLSGRANRGLLAEALAPAEAGASLATGTKRRSASLSAVALAKAEALAAISRGTVRDGRKKDEVGAEGMEERVLIRPYLCAVRAFQLCSRITSTSRILTGGALKAMTVSAIWRPELTREGKRQQKISQ